MSRPRGAGAGFPTTGGNGGGSRLGGFRVVKGQWKKENCHITKGNILGVYRGQIEIMETKLELLFMVYGFRVHGVGIPRLRLRVSGVGFRV